MSGADSLTQRRISWRLLGYAGRRCREGRLLWQQAGKAKGAAAAAAAAALHACLCGGVTGRGASAQLSVGLGACVRVAGVGRCRVDRDRRSLAVRQCRGAWLACERRARTPFEQLESQQCPAISRWCTPVLLCVHSLCVVLGERGVEGCSCLCGSRPAKLDNCLLSASVSRRRRGVNREGTVPRVCSVPSRPHAHTTHTHAHTSHDVADR